MKNEYNTIVHEGETMFLHIEGNCGLCNGGLQGACYDPDHKFVPSLDDIFNESIINKENTVGPYFKTLDATGLIKGDFIVLDNEKENTVNNEYANMSIEELEEALAENLESGADIYNIGNSVWESEEEFQTELHKLTVEQNLIQEAINNKENLMNNDNEFVICPDCEGRSNRDAHTNCGTCGCAGIVPNENFTTTTKENKMKKYDCHAITQAGQKCKGKHCTIPGFVLTLKGQAVHESLVNPDNMPGWFRVELPFCPKHTQMLLDGRKIKIQSLRDASKITQPSLPGIPEKVEAKKGISCGHCGQSHPTIDEVKACSGVAMKRTKAPISIKKEVLCGNCRKNGVDHPYHNNAQEVKACYASK